jgi:TonB family protein
MVLEEPEPIDGWDNYDTYLANNIRLPEKQQVKQKVSGEVQLSFEINRDGDPVNITVDRSLCQSCDQEAIRLVKEGPKWKRKTRKGRTSVTVNF